MKRQVREGRFGPPIDLLAMEEEVLAEGREWMRRRMEDKLREAAKASSSEEEKKTPTSPTPEADHPNPERSRRRAGSIRPGP